MNACRFLTVLTMILSLLASFQSGAAEPREITWDDLVPAEAQFDDPFTKLDEDTLYELSLVAQIRDRIAAGQQIDERTMQNYRERVKQLEEDEVDVDGLIGMREKVTQERIAKTYLANKELVGKPVRIPGYLLPLEYDGDKVVEFFLVPYVGACIHTPPPPPNQIVHVETSEGFSVEGLYTPVWVNGLLENERSESSLSYVDGSSNIPSSYSLKATLVEAYE